MKLEVEEVIQYTSNILVSRRKYLEKHAKDEINTQNKQKLRKEEISKIVEEAYKGVPICNYGIVRDLFEECRSNSIIVWVNPLTAEFDRKKKNHLYISLRITKRYGKLTFDNDDPNSKRLRDKFIENTEAKNKFIETINHLSKNLDI